MTFGESMLFSICPKIEVIGHGIWSSGSVRHHGANPNLGMVVDRHGGQFDHRSHLDICRCCRGVSRPESRHGLQHQAHGRAIVQVKFQARHFLTPVHRPGGVYWPSGDLNLLPHELFQLSG